MKDQILVGRAQLVLMMLALAFSAASDAMDRAISHHLFGAAFWVVLGSVWLALAADAAFCRRAFR